MPVVTCSLGAPQRSSVMRFADYCSFVAYCAISSVSVTTGGPEPTGETRTLDALPWPTSLPPTLGQVSSVSRPRGPQTDQDLGRRGREISCAKKNAGSLRGKCRNVRKIATMVEKMRFSHISASSADQTPPPPSINGLWTSLPHTHRTFVARCPDSTNQMIPTHAPAQPPQPTLQFGLWAADHFLSRHICWCPGSAVGAYPTVVGIAPRQIMNSDAKYHSSTPAPRLFM